MKAHGLCPLCDHVVEVNVNEWGKDSLSRFIDKHITTLIQDAPTAIALINRDPKKDESIISGMKPFDAFSLGHTSQTLGIFTYSLFFYGFSHESQTAVGQFLAALASIPIDEGMIYVNGEARMRLETCPVQPLPRDSK